MTFPGPISRPLLAELGRYVIADPYPFVLDLPRCRGLTLVTVDGDELLDWAGYYGAKLLGHNHPRLYVPEYVQRLAVAANNKTANPDFLTPECLAYYRLLHSLAPACMRNERLEVYAVNSGAEAVENMMKYLINLHHYKLLAAGKKPGVHRFLFFDQAFHGRTVFALNVTHIDSAPVITRDFQGLFSGNLQMRFPALHNERPAAENAASTAQSLAEIEAALQRYGDEVVGIIVEPIQGAGGHRLAQPEFFQRLSALAHRYDVFLGFDEIQTAGGQTGTFFAIDQFDLPHPPQAVAAAKKLGNGAIYMLYPMQDRGVLDSTWGGTLADMVRFTEEMKIVREERLIEQVPEKAAQLVQGLQALERDFPQLLYNVRGMGLYQGFTLRRSEWRDTLTDLALQEERLLLLGAGRLSIRFRPVLDVTPADTAEMLARLRRSLARLSAIIGRCPGQPEPEPCQDRSRSSGPQA
jgi:L-lysine 6-transaminase